MRPRLPALRLLVWGFALALTAPLADRALRPGAAAAAIEREMRRPAPLPGLPRNLDECIEWPARAEAWHADTLGLRDQLLRAHNALELFGFRRAPNETLCLGNEGWIFLTGDSSREAWRGRIVLEPGLVEGWVRALHARESWFRARGMRFLHVIAPNKETLYPEHLPAGEVRLGPSPREQLLARFAREDPPLPLLDLVDVLEEEKRHDVPSEDDFVFHRRGSHWTARGAFAATQAIVARLAREFPALAPARREDYERRELRGDPGDSWAQSLSLEDVLGQRVWDFAPREPAARCVARGGGKRYTDHSATWENPRQELPSLLLVSDSFGPWVHPLLAEHASHLVFAWRSSIPQQELVSAHPQAVIELYVERHLIELPRPLSEGLRVLSAEEFLGLPPLAEADPRALLAGVEGYRGTRIEFAAGVLRLAAREGADKLLLPPLVPPPGTHLALHLMLDSPADTLGLLWFQSATQPQYEQRTRLAFELSAGRNELYVELPVDDLRGRVLLEPGLIHGEYVLRTLEARAAPRQ